MTESIKSNFFGLLGCPAFAELCGVLAKSAVKAGCGFGFGIGYGCFCGFDMGRITLADAFSGAFVAFGDFFPFVGGCVPVMVERVGINGLFLFGECRIFEFDSELNLSFFGAGGRFYNGHCGFRCFGSGGNTVSNCGCRTFGVIAAPYICCGDSGDFSSANGANSRVGSGRNVVTVIGRTIDIIECDYIIFLKDVLVKAGICSGIKLGCFSVYLEHPA